jgi:hypothetical protein
MPRAAGGTSSLDQAVFFLHLGRARERVSAGRLDEARQELELASLVRPADPDLLSLVSLVEFRRGDYEEASRAARALVEANPGSAILHANLGLIRLKAGALDEAERQFKRAIALKPDHVRSRLYLGLVRQMREGPRPALAGFPREDVRGPAAEIEDTVPQTPATLSALPHLEPVRSLPPERPAASFASSTRRDAEDRPLFRAFADGTLEVASRGLVYVRRGSVVWYSGRLRFSEEPAFAGTRLERLVKVEGTGDLLLCDADGRCVVREASGQSLHLEGGRVVALSSSLQFCLEPIQDFRTHRRMDILKVRGRGGAVVSVSGPLEAHDVAPDFPLTVSSRDLVAWTGELLPSVVEDRFLEDIMLPDAGNAPRLRFEGEGAVLTEGPRKL